jgi:hypothetical protein
MLSAFQDWLNGNFQSLQSNQCKFNIKHCGEKTDNPAIRVDVETSRVLGRLTVWESGNCTMEVIDIESEQMLMDEYRHLTSDNFDNSFRSFFQNVSNCTN